MNRLRGISPVLGIILLTAVTVVLVGSAAFFVFDFGESTELSIGTATVRADYATESAITATLINKGSADDVIIRTALGTEYTLSQLGDSVTILNQKENSTPVALAVNNGEQNVLRDIPPQSFRANTTVDKNGTEEYVSLQNAVDNTSTGGIIAIERGVYYENLNISTANLTIVAEQGTVIGDSVESADSVIDIQSQGVRLSNILIDANTSQGGTAANHAVTTSRNVTLVNVSSVGTGGTVTSGDGTVKRENSPYFVAPERADGISSATATPPTEPELLNWNNSSDWDNAVSESGVAHEDVSNTDHNNAGVIQKGYSISENSNQAETVSYFPLHENSGSTAFDFARTSDGSVSGPNQGVTGLVGTSAYSFDSTDDTVNFGSSLGGYSEMTWTLWVKWDGTSPEKYSPRPLSNQQGYTVQINKGSDTQFNFRDSSGNSFTVRGPVIQSNSWVFLSATYNSTEMRAYINGDLVGIKSVTGNDINQNSNSLLLGDDSTGENQYSGLIAHGQIYSQSLTSAEIQNRYEAIKKPGTLTTQTKSSDEAYKANLANLSYTLNGGSINVTVIGSPSTSDEERQTVTLNGTSSYNLSWTQAHSTYQIKLKLSHTDITKTPTISKIQLKPPSG